MMKNSNGPVIALEEHYWDQEVVKNFAGESGRTTETSKRLYDLGELRLKEMDEAGIDIQVLSHASPPAQILPKDVAVDVTRRANDRLHAAIDAHPKRFAAFAMLPTSDPAAAADELERAVVKLGFKGAMISGLDHGQFVDDKRFWPIFARAEKLDVPIYLHPSTPHPTVVDVYYKDYVGQIVSRYKDDPRILMWQLMNEAEGEDTSGNSDAQALYNFALDMSAYVKSIDPNHLVSLGTMGGGQPGTQGGDYRWIHSIPSIDLLEYHDYDEPVSFSDDLAQRVEDSLALKKPLFVGESGIKSNCSEPDCLSPGQRAALFDAKMTAAFDNGVSGYMIWSYRNAVEPPTEYIFTLTDPLAAIVQKFASLVG